MLAKIISLEKCKYYFDFDEQGNLYWKNVNENCRNGNAVVGCIAGNIYKNNKYYVVMIDGKTYTHHRILYQLYNNIQLTDTQQIDHVNRIKTDNRKENLEIVTPKQNSRNKKTRKDNLSTGIKNISLTKDKKYYNLNIFGDTTRFQKYYRTDKHTIEDVIKIRDKMLVELHGKNASFG